MAKIDFKKLKALGVTAAVGLAALGYAGAANAQAAAAESNSNSAAASQSTSNSASAAEAHGGNAASAAEAHGGQGGSVNVPRTQIVVGVDPIAALNLAVGNSDIRPVDIDCVSTAQHGAVETTIRVRNPGLIGRIAGRQARAERTVVRNDNELAALTGSQYGNATCEQPQRVLITPTPDLPVEGPQVNFPQPAPTPVPCQPVRRSATGVISSSQPSTCRPQ